MATLLSGETIAEGILKKLEKQKFAKKLKSANKFVIKTPRGRMITPNGRKYIDRKGDI